MYLHSVLCALITCVVTVNGIYYHFDHIHFHLGVGTVNDTFIDIWRDLTIFSYGQAVQTRMWSGTNAIVYFQVGDDTHTYTRRGSYTIYPGLRADHHSTYKCQPLEVAESF